MDGRCSWCCCLHQNIPLIPFHPPRNLRFPVLDAKARKATMNPSDTRPPTLMFKSRSVQETTSYSPPVIIPLLGGSQWYQVQYQCDQALHPHGHTQHPYHSNGLGGHQILGISGVLAIISLGPPSWIICQLVIPIFQEGKDIFLGGGLGLGVVSVTRYR